MEGGFRFSGALVNKKVFNEWKMKMGRKKIFDLQICSLFDSFCSCCVGLEIVNHEQWVTDRGDKLDKTCYGFFVFRRQDHISTPAASHSDKGFTGPKCHLLI